MKRILILFCLGLAVQSGLFGQKEGKFDLNFDDIFKNGVFSQKFAAPFNVMNDGINFSVLEKDGDADWKIVAKSLESGEIVNTIFSSKNLGQKITPDNYEFSDDESHLLITTESEQIYRHSSKSKTWIINLKTNELTEIKGGKVMYPTLSPDNSQLAYVMDNNLFTFNLATKAKSQITSDGLVNSIINGAVDWVYEEEFSMSKGFEWSSDGKKLAYYRFDESLVKEFSMDMWGQLYPKQERWKYPKAGEANSVVDVFIYNLDSKTAVKCATGSENDQYLPRIKWTQDPNVLSIQRLNRKQNYWELLFHHAVSGNVEVIISETANTYIDIDDDLFFIPGEKQFIYSSEKDGFNHLYCYDYGKKKEAQLTKGEWDVTHLNGVDEKAKRIYYSSSEISAKEDHFFVIDFKGKNKKNLTPSEGNHVITMGKGNRYYTDMYSRINAPYLFTLNRANGTEVKVLESNTVLRNTMERYRFGSSEFGEINTQNGKLNYWMMKPHNFDPSKKYPVLMHVYGGPGHNTVRNSYGGRNFLWHQYLTNLGYIVVSVDNRGTGNRGRDFKHSTYLQLGKLELQDQTDAAKWFASQPWVDSARIGIWGWSFGGYMSSLCITKSADVFKTAIAVAPVTNWRFYDNIYTERFLQKPQDNAAGYDDNSPINFVNGIKGNYLIIHGTGDDNVHFQNSVEMVNAMIKTGVNYDSEFYPNRNHGIGDRAASYHLYRRMTDYLLEHL